MLHKFGDTLYAGVHDQVSKHLQEKANDVAQVADDHLLVALQECWLEHKVTITMIRDILMYMVSPPAASACPSRVAP